MPSTYSAPAPRQRYVTALLHRDNYVTLQRALLHQRYLTALLRRDNVTLQRSCTETTLRYSAPTPRQRYGTTLLHEDRVTEQRSYTKTTLWYSAPAPRHRYGTALLHRDTVTVQRSCTETALLYRLLHRGNVKSKPHDAFVDSISSCGGNRSV